jgi:hypothetical protein
MGMKYSTVPECEFGGGTMDTLTTALLYAQDVGSASKTVVLNVRSQGTKYKLETSPPF